jgi:uncharacterized protein (TIGR03435 family)
LDAFIGQAGLGFYASDHMSMQNLVAGLTHQLGLPVINETGIEGQFKITLKFLPENAPPGMVGPSVFTALRETLGLKLDSKRVTIDCVVIERINHVPTGN